MNNKKDLLIGFGIAIFFVIACILFYHFGRNSKIDNNIVQIIRDTTIITKVDTLIIEKPVEKIRYKDKLVYVPVIDTLFVHGNDTTYIAMQSEKVVYEEEEYKAIISGVQPKLEEMTVYPKTIYQTVTEKQIVQKKWNFNITAGPAIIYDFGDRQIKGGIGIVAGIGYSF